MKTADPPSKSSIDRRADRRLLRFLDTVRTAQHRAVSPTSHYQADPRQTWKRPDGIPSEAKFIQLD